MLTSDIFESLEAARLRLLETIDPLPDEALLAPNAVGDLSVRDILVLITVWESELITGLRHLLAGKKPQNLLAALKNKKGYNAARLRENQGRELDIIFDDLQGAYIQLEQWLGDLSDKDFTNPKRFKGLKGRPLWPIVAEASFKLETSFLAGLEQYADEWEAQAADQTFIPLLTIDELVTPNLVTPDNGLEVTDGND